MLAAEALTIERAEAGSAVYDTQLLYRYLLNRTWDTKGPRICWALLNPSTATATANDRTITRVVGFSRSWGFGSVDVVNLFALRSTDPATLGTVNDPVGTCNDDVIAETVVSSRKVVLAWGTNGDILNPSTGVPRNEDVLGILRQVDAVCLGRTGSGQPRHPLYLPGSMKPVRYSR